MFTCDPESALIDFGGVEGVGSVPRNRAAEDKPFGHAVVPAVEKLVTPPDVGAADASLVMLIPRPATTQPQTVATGYYSEGHKTETETMKGGRHIMPEEIPKTSRSPAANVELLLVAQVCQKSFVCLAVLVLHDSGRDKRTILL